MDEFEGFRESRGAKRTKGGGGGLLKSLQREGGGEDTRNQSVGRNLAKRGLLMEISFVPRCVPR